MAPGYAPPTVAPYAGNKTLKGLRTLRAAVRWAIGAAGIFLIIDFLTIVATVWAFVALAEFDTAILSNALAVSFLLIFVTIAWWVLALVTLSLGAVALYRMNVGRREFGEAHLLGVENGIIYAWFSALLFGASFVLGLISGGSIISNPVLASSLSQMSFLLLVVMPGTALLSFGGVLCAAVAMRALVSNLVTPAGARSLSTFWGVAIAGGLFSLGGVALMAFMTLGAPATDASDAETVKFLGRVLGATIFGTALNLVGVIATMFSLRAYDWGLREAAKRVRRTLRHRQARHQESTPLATGTEIDL